MVLPGLGAADSSTAPLRWYLRRIGHHVQGWELGAHRPQVTASLERFTSRLQTAVDVAGEPFVLVGWSLGGVVARETARNRPDLVSQIITFGSPLSGFNRLIGSRRRRRIQVPTTTIYSRRDGVVNWRHAIDREPGARHIEVSSSHVGLGVDPDVWRTIATTIDTPHLEYDYSQNDRSSS